MSSERILILVIMWLIACSLVLSVALQMLAVVVVLRQPPGQRDWNRWEIAAMIGVIVVVFSAIAKQAIWKQAATPYAFDVLVFSVFSNFKIFSSTMSRGRGERIRQITKRYWGL